MSLDKIKLSELLEEVSKRGFISQQREVLINRTYKFPKQKKPFKIGVVSDTHLGSEHQQLTYLRAAYDIFKKEGIKKVFHAGDVVEGNGRLFKGQQFEMFLHGADAMVKYTIEAFPKVPGITTYMIGGSHDYSFYKESGVDVLAKIADKREDIEYLGISGATVVLNGLKVYLMHGDGGNAYARSYKMQKIIEQFPADKKPNILLLGHYHVTCSLPWYRNVTAFQLPCFQTQTQYLRAKGLAPDLGFLILEITPDPKGIATFKPYWHPFWTGIDGDF